MAGEDRAKLDSAVHAIYKRSPLMTGRDATKLVSIEHDGLRTAFAYSMYKQGIISGGALNSIQFGSRF